MKFKVPSAFSILFIICAIAAITTWVLPAGLYKFQEPDGTVVTTSEKTNKARPIPGSYYNVENNPQSFFAVAKTLPKGFYAAREVIIFVLIIGGFINIAMESGAIQNGIRSLLYRFKGREQLLIPILMCLFATGGTVYGMSEEGIGFVPLIVASMMLAGYDKLVGVAIVLIGCRVGFMASIINPFSTGMASDIVGITIFDGMLLRIIMFVLLTATAIFLVMRYAAKIKKNPKASLVYSSYEEDKKHFLGTYSTESVEKTIVTGKQKCVLIVFMLTFVVMVYGVIPFSMLGITVLPDLGWWLTDISAVFIISSVIMGVIARMSEKEIVKHFVKGVEGIASVALLIGLSRGATVLMEDGLVAGTILNYGETLVTGLSSYAFVTGVFFVEFVLAAVFPTSTSLAAFSLPIIGPIATFAEVDQSFIVTAFSSSGQLFRIITPTSYVNLACLAVATVRVDRWLVFIWPIFLVLGAIALLTLMGGLYFA